MFLAILYTLIINILRKSDHKFGKVSSKETHNLKNLIYKHLKNIFSLYSKKKKIKLENNSSYFTRH